MWCLKSGLLNKEYPILYRIFFLSLNIEISAEDWELTRGYKNPVRTAGGTFDIQNIFSEIQDL